MRKNEPFTRLFPRADPSVLRRRWTSTRTPGSSSGPHVPLPRGSNRLLWPFASTPSPDPALVTVRAQFSPEGSQQNIYTGRDEHMCSLPSRPSSRGALRSPLTRRSPRRHAPHTPKPACALTAIPLRGAASTETCNGREDTGRSFMPGEALGQPAWDGKNPTDQDGQPPGTRPTHRTQAALGD